MRWLLVARLRPFVLLAALASLVLNLMLLMPALYMLQVFDRVFASRSLETLAMLSLALAVTLALAGVMDVVRSRALAWAGQALARRLAPQALHASLQRAAQAGGAREGDTPRDVGALRAFLGGQGVQALFDAPWVPLHLLVIGLMHPLLGGAATLGALALFGLALLTQRLTSELAQAAQRQTRATQRHAQSLLRHADAIVGMGMGGNAVRGWEQRHGQALAAQQGLGTRMALLGASARIARQALQAGLLGLGAWLVVAQHASPGIMVAATVLLGRALQPVELLIAGWKTLVEARAAWQRLEAPGTAAARQERVALPAPQGRLEVERVVFGLVPQRPPLIKGVGFSLEPGESLGLIGPSASGKSTLLRLLLGLWQPQGGTVRLDGADIAQWDRDALGVHVGYLPQDVELFAGTVAENIARLGQVHDARVVEAARLAHAHEMILRLPKGYDTPVGEAGAALSGGQRQRIALARALYGTPRLVLLDEPNAHLDAEGEAALAAALRELKQRGCTVVVVTHRPALVSQFDKLGALKDGVLEAFGAPSAIGAPVRAVPARPPREAALQATG
jgi:PrtD family type I secretion system ABC transporter